LLNVRTSYLKAAGFIPVEYCRIFRLQSATRNRRFTFSESLAKIWRDLSGVDTRPGKIKLLSQRSLFN